MPKYNIAFFEIEPWEEKYLRAQLANQKNLSLSFSSQPLSPRSLAKIKKADILVTFIYSPVKAEIIQKLPNLKFVTTMSTGFDHIDLAACQTKNIKVSNVPYYGENTVAEHTFALILGLSRRLTESVDSARRGDFTLSGLRGFDLKDKVLGIIGLGHIGECVARIARGFEMEILVFDPHQNKRLAKELGFKYVSLDNLLKKSDIVSLHAPYNSHTHHLINKTNIQKMKRSAYLINTARGALVETEALIWALNNNRLAGAGLDVFEEEYFIKEEKELLSRSFQDKYNLRTALQNHILMNDRRLLVTPHNAFNSQEALQRILDTTVENITAFLKKKPKNLVKLKK